MRSLGPISQRFLEGIGGAGANNPLYSVDVVAMSTERGSRKPSEYKDPFIAERGPNGREAEEYLPGLFHRTTWEDMRGDF